MFILTSQQEMPKRIHKNSRKPIRHVKSQKMQQGIYELINQLLGDGDIQGAYNESV